MGLSLTHFDSLWLLWLSRVSLLTHFDSHWLTLAHFDSLWLTLTLFVSQVFFAFDSLPISTWSKRDKKEIRRRNTNGGGSRTNSCKSVKWSAVPVAPMWVYEGVRWLEGQRPRRGRWPMLSEFQEFGPQNWNSTMDNLITNKANTYKSRARLT